MVQEQPRDGRRGDTRDKTLEKDQPMEDQVVASKKRKVSPSPVKKVFFCKLKLKVVIFVFVFFHFGLLINTIISHLLIQKRKSDTSDSDSESEAVESEESEESSVESTPEKKKKKKKDKKKKKRKETSESSEVRFFFLRL